ncbi:MAG TPA: histidinol-phosphate transaminase [Candidatus Dormibacteraeota bacterium]|nr:histidinol-phosphate transaminase [Candidatus Dormibacteraeota bacterium]
MSTLRRASLGAGFGYTPGEQPPDGEGWLKLNTNESPLPPSPAVAPAVERAAALLHRYPDPYGEPLRSALARHHGVGPESVFVANGADQVIDCLFRAHCEPGDRVVWPDPTYSLFPVLARMFGVVPVELPLDPDLGLPAALGIAPGRLRFVVNPNAPTGVWTAPETLEELLGPAEGVVAIDEAYCDFAPASCIPLLGRHPTWLVLRTFSKGYALAGLRVGYAVGDPELIADLLAVKDSYPVDRCAIAGAAAALADQEHHRGLVEGVRSERSRLSERLAAAGWRVTPSEANFVFARPPGGDARSVLARLRERRILVRHFAGEHADRLRITVGAPAENDRLLDALGV